MLHLRAQDWKVNLQEQWFTFWHASEISDRSLALLQSLPDRPLHIFKDMLKMLPEDDHAKLVAMRPQAFESNEGKARSRICTAEGVLATAALASLQAEHEGVELHMP